MPRLLLAAFLLWSAALAPAAAQSEASFRAWMAFCDNLRDCSAYGMPPEGEASYGFLRVRRAGAADAPVEAAILLIDGGSGLARLTFDSETDPGAAAAVEAAEPSGRIELPQDRTGWLLDGLRRATVLTLRWNAGGDPVTIPLSGASAALRWMDDQQRRAGTVTALVARGEKPASEVPPVPPEPVVRKAKVVGGKLPPLPPALKDLQRKECSIEPPVKPDGLRLSAGLTLWSVPCDRGAYNESVVFYLVRDGQSALQPVVFDMPPALASEQRDNILVNSGIEPDGTVSSFSKGRGIADCGSAGTWAWDGKAFRLVAYSAMPACRGVPPDEWPVRWRAQLK